MNKEKIKENYSTFSTEELIKLASEINSINPDYLPLLQSELINRNENKIALSITEYLISIKYHITESIIFDTILNHRKDGLTEKEIDDKLKEQHGIDSNYANLIRISLKEKGKENIAIGIAMILVPLILGIILISTMRTFIGIIPILFIGIGIWRFNLGLRQKRQND